MRRLRARPALLPALSLIFIRLAAAPGDAEAKESPKLEGVRVIQVLSVSGDLEIEAAGAEDALVISGDDEDAPDVSREGDRLTVRTRVANLKLRIPASRKLEVDSVTGEVRVRGSCERVEVHTTSGDVHVEGASDLVKVNTLSGDISAVGASKNVKIETTSGDVRVEGARGDVDLRTTSGELIIADSSAHRLDAQTVSGDFRYSGKLVADAAISVRAVSGDVRFEIGGPLDAHVEARTRSGEVRIEGMPHEDEQTRRVERMFGRGGANLRAITFSGDITISSD